MTIRRFGLLRDNRGSTAMIVVVMLSVMVGSVGLAVDGGRVALERTRLQGVADAAALAASSMQAKGQSASTAAQSIAESNLPGRGSRVVATADVASGKWTSASRSFDTSSTTPDGVRVVAREASSNGLPYPLMFGAIIGAPTADLVASATAIATSTCTPNPQFTVVSPFIPTRGAVVTMGETDPANPGVPRYLATPDGHPIIRVDSTVNGPATITISINGRPDVTVVTPGKGSFWTALTGITVTKAAIPSQADVVLVHKFKSSLPSQPFNAGSTATWNNNLRNTPLPGTSICIPGTARTTSKLVG